MAQNQHQRFPLIHLFFKRTNDEIPTQNGFAGDWDSEETKSTSSRSPNKPTQKRTTWPNVQASADIEPKAKAYWFASNKPHFDSKKNSLGPTRRPSKDDVSKKDIAKKVADAAKLKVGNSDF